MLIKIDCDGRDFIINSDEIKSVFEDKIIFKNGGLMSITKKEFNQISGVL